MIVSQNYLETTSDVFKDLTDLLDVQSGGTLRAGETILKSIMSSIGVNSGEEGFAALLNLESTKDWVKFIIAQSYLDDNEKIHSHHANSGQENIYFSP